MPSEETEWTGRRADARRNHDEVLAAAGRAFAEHGKDATIPDIAARAGVGKATVYRSYPTKDDLIRAVARDQIAWFDERVQAASGDPDAYGALGSLLGDISVRLAEDRLFSQVLVSAEQWHKDGGRSAAFAILLERAQGEGRIREDVTTHDIRVLVGGFARVLAELGIRDPAQWRRYATLTLNALRPS